MDKRKIVHAAREKIRGESNSSGSEKVSAGGDKSLLGDVINAFIDIVGDSSNDDLSESQSARENGKSGKTSGRKPQSQGRVSSVAGRVADQLRDKK